MKARRAIGLILIIVFALILMRSSGSADVTTMTRDELQTMINNAQNGDRVTMTGALSVKQETTDVHLTIPAGKEIILDLAGYQIVGNKYRVIVIEEGASLTLENNPSESSFKVGTITKESNMDSYQGCIVNYGTFILNNGTIKSQDYWIVDNYGTFVMNGGTLEGDSLGKDYAVRNTGTFRMTDGTIKNKLAGVLNRGTFYLEGGSIKDNKGWSSYPWTTSNTSAAVVNEGGTMVMSGGSISGNVMSTGGAICNKALYGSEGNIYGSLMISGGAITGNEGRTGGIISYNNCPLTICGGTITGNIGRDSYGTSGSSVCGGILAYSGLNLYGKVTVQNNSAEIGNTVPTSNLKLLNSSKINLPAALDEDSRIGLYTWNFSTSNVPEIISTNLTVNGTQRAGLKNFPVDNTVTSSGRQYVSTIAGGELALSLNITIQFQSIDPELNTSMDSVVAAIGSEIVLPDWNKGDPPFGKYFDGWRMNLNGQTIVYAAGEQVTVNGAMTTLYANWQETWPMILGELEDGGEAVSVILGGNANKRTNDTITVSAGKTLTLDLNGWELRAVSSEAITVEEGGTLILKDTAGGGRITGTGSDTSSYSLIVNYGTVYIQGGSVGYGYGAALRNFGKVVMTGGGISNVTISPYAVYNHPEATFTMSGGEISGNIGALDNGGTFTLAGGSIHDNKTGQYTIRNGYLGGTAQLIMTGGSILDNEASSVGGIYNTGNNSVFRMSGGVISGNKATSAGSYGSVGAVDVQYGSFEMTGGSITGNTGLGDLRTSTEAYKKQFSGGVRCQNSGKFSIAGNVNISGNTAVHYNNNANTRNVDVTLDNMASIQISGPLDSLVSICLWPRYVSGTKEFDILQGALPEGEFPWALPSNFTITSDDLRTWQIIPHDGELILAKSITDVYLVEAFGDTEFTVPESVTLIQAEAFAGTSPDSICIPGSANSVTIGSGAFRDCKALRKIRIPDNVTSVADDAFDSRSVIIIFGKRGSTADAFAESHQNCFFIGE